MGISKNLSIIGIELIITFKLIIKVFQSVHSKSLSNLALNKTIKILNEMGY